MKPIDGAASPRPKTGLSTKGPLSLSSNMELKPVRKASIAIGCAAVLGLFSAHAQNPDFAKQCRHLTDRDARLACYDAAFGVPSVPSTLQAAVAASPSHAQPAAPAPQAVPSPVADAPQIAQPPVATISQSVPQPQREQAQGEAQFGDRGQLHRNLKSNDGAPKSITATVQAASALASGLYRITLDNGQSWRTTQADWAVGFNAGDLVTISRLPLGGYQISMAGTSRSVGALRIQ